MFTVTSRIGPSGYPSSFSSRETTSASPSGSLALSNCVPQPQGARGRSDFPSSRPVIRQDMAVASSPSAAKSYPKVAAMARNSSMICCSSASDTSSCSMRMPGFRLAFTWLPPMSTRASSSQAPRGRYRSEGCGATMCCSFLSIVRTFTPSSSQSSPGFFGEITQGRGILYSPMASWTKPRPLNWERSGSASTCVACLGAAKASESRRRGNK
mmetsp:Transcript_112750/g.351572  ORF Transcript_112750/g.351572 Transcript_112750/m.351572 type:complete len:212 (-) Transcript_112750:243-878(-)